MLLQRSSCTTTLAYVMWTRGYDLARNLLWSDVNPAGDGGFAWGVSASVGPRGEIYALCAEDTDAGAAPVVLRWVSCPLRTEDSCARPCSCSPT